MMLILRRAAAFALSLLFLASCATESAGPPTTPPPPVVSSLPPEPVTPPAPSYADDELGCLALTVYWEGKSESREGQVAIAHVVLNRVADARFPHTICGVVHDGGQSARGRCQFKWWCDGKSDTPSDPVQWAKAQRIAREESKAGTSDPTNGALFFHARSVDPGWTHVHKRVAAIGGHVFYR